MKRGIFIIMLALGGCTFQQQEGEPRSEFHPPLTYATWKTEQYKTEAGSKVCAVTSGHNGLSILSHKAPNGSITVSAKSERKLTPGMNLRVNVNGNHYRTSEEYFSDSESLKIANDLSAGDKAYLEWSEPHGHHHSMLRTSNILKLEGFKPQFEQCQKSLLSQELLKQKKKIRR